MAVIWHGRVCLRAFVLGFLIIIVPLVGYLSTTLSHFVSSYWYLLLVLYIAGVNGAVFAFLKDQDDYQVRLAAFIARWSVQLTLCSLGFPVCAVLSIWLSLMLHLL